MPGRSVLASLAIVLLCGGSGVTGASDGPRLFIAGDSTASSYPAERAPQTGWGQALPYFLSDGVTVVNRAVSGRSTKSYIDEGRWNALLSELQAGDTVLISFGHNDSRDDAPERFTEADGAFRGNLVRFAHDVRSKDATPVILSPAARRLWEGPAMVETHGLYAENSRIAAAEADVDFIDLANLTIAYFETLGREGTKADYLWLTPANAIARFPEGVEDNTHFTELGACGVARVVAIALAATADADLVATARIGPDGDAAAQSRPPRVVSCAAAIKRD